jgi:hypothetical protein
MNQSTISNIDSEDIIEQIKLPFSSECNKYLEFVKSDSLEKLCEELPNHIKISGRLKKAKNYTAYLTVDCDADYQIHYLTTISNDGLIIEHFNLFSGGCAEDEFFWGMSEYTISDNLEITQNDSSARYRRNENGDILKETMQTKSQKLNYYLNQNGKTIKKGT